MSISENNGLIQVDSRYTFKDTLRRIEAIILTRGLRIFARIDHSGEAAQVGLKMNPTQLLIFGNAKSGTPLMIASPTLAIDLPLKLLVWEDGNGKVRIFHNSPEYLKERHSIPEALLKNISGVQSIVEEALSNSAEVH